MKEGLTHLVWREGGGRCMDTEYRMKLVYRWTREGEGGERVKMKI
jgi:hypothetical protein